MFLVVCAIRTTKNDANIIFKGDEIYFYHFNNPNSCTVEELQQACEFPSHKFKSLDELPKDSMKIICGSFYMLNEVVTEPLVLQPFLQEGS